jgi:hypothetical protein
MSKIVVGRTFEKEDISDLVLQQLLAAESI